jgi:NADH-quinone oxidoreductase subunit L
MFLGVGVGAYAAGVFHLMTHAFFKALLFLGAGSVIHGMGGIQDLRKMGGLRREMPWTFRTFLIGGLALAGFPGLAGFFSKDAVLWGAFSYPAFGPILWSIGVVAAGLTAFYTFRLIILAFFGASRHTDVDTHVHESPASMTIPLVLLAAFSVVAGWVGVPPVLGGNNRFERFLESVVGAGIAEGDHTVELLVMGTSVAAGLAGMFLAWMFYARRPGAADAVAGAVPRVYRLLTKRYYVDEAYDAAVVRPVLETSRRYLWRWVDAGSIDGAVNGTGRAIAGLGEVLRRMQAGNVRAYAGWILTGGILILLGLLFG